MQEVQNFTMALKVGSKQIRFNININDNKDRLFEKIAGIHPQCKDKKEEILQKLRKDLEGKIANYHVKQNLRIAIKQYLQRTFIVEEAKEEQESPEKQKNIDKNASKLEITKTPLERNKQNINTPSCNRSSQAIKHQSLSKHNKSIGKINRRAASQRSSLNKESHNEDVVKACQVILQKTNQKDMKAMARRYLQDIGRLPEEEKHKSAFVVREERTSLQKNPIAESSQIQERQQEKELPKQNSFARSKQYISPIVGLNRSTQRTSQYSTLTRNPGIVSFKPREPSNPRNFRGNRFRYISALEPSFQADQFSALTLQTSVRASPTRQRKFNYLQNVELDLITKY